MEKAGSTQGAEKCIKSSGGNPEKRESFGRPDNRRE
jgi:hypothetical protein